MLVRETGLPFRLAHKVVAGMVQAAVKAGIPSSQLTLDLDLLASARRARCWGVNWPFTEAQFTQALDPAHFVAVRAGEGGVAPGATAAVLDA
jgi:argininosuccinate lyase